MITRRRVLAAAGASGLMGAAPSSLPAQPGLLVAGPTGSPLWRWAEVIAPVLGQSMLAGDPLGLEAVGGADGVTGVNQFQAQVAPDGATGLLLPGTALLAWLVGDNRVRFDTGSWAPLWGGRAGAMVASRGGIAAGRKLRIAVGRVVGPELEALLALHMMGVEVVPVAMSGPDKLLQRDVDAVYCRGPVSLERLAQAGWTPGFALEGSSDLPPASTLFTAARLAEPSSMAAFRAVSAAASLDVALVLPAVAPATVLAWWRRGCEQLDEAPAVRAAAMSAGVQQDDAGSIAAQLASVSLDTASMLALRTVLAERFKWQPG